jgi:Rod binding domain-containing protein
MIPGIGTPASSPPHPTPPVKIKDAAGQFEALLITQMLKSARESTAGGWTGDSQDSSAASVMEMSEQHLAQVLASQGGLGLARMIVDGLSRESAALKQGNPGDAEGAGGEAKAGVGQVDPA